MLFTRSTRLTMGPTVSETNGHPSDQWGWAVGAGLHINMPIPGDYIEGEVNYSQGASKYAAKHRRAANSLWSSGCFGIVRHRLRLRLRRHCYRWVTTGTNCLLTTAWSAAVGYEHFWTPQWHESFTGSYMAESYSTAANAILCTLEGRRTVPASVRRLWRWLVATTIGRTGRVGHASAVGRDQELLHRCGSPLHALQHCDHALPGCCPLARFRRCL